MKEQGRVWWAMEAKNGAGWYLQPEIFAQAEGYFVSSLSLVTMTGTLQLKKLIRSGIPPQLRPRVWSAVSGASKRRSSAPESYYSDLLAAVEGRETPATRQIDHVTILKSCYALPLSLIHFMLLFKLIDHVTSFETCFTVITVIDFTPSGASLKHFRNLVYNVDPYHCD